VKHSPVRPLGPPAAQGLSHGDEQHGVGGACQSEPEPRMGRKATAQAFACAESFSKTLKWELETLDGRHAEAKVRQSVFMYLEAYYNRVRIHSALDYVTPSGQPY
jgi:transposase InsO family protein